MSNKKTKPENPYVFPAIPGQSLVGKGDLIHGITLRDYFAAKAMQGMLVGLLTNYKKINRKIIAKDAYVQADAMLEERQKEDKS